MVNADVLRRTYLFDHLSNERIAHIAEVLIERVLKPGEGLFELGDIGNEMYIVSEGRIAIFVPDASNPGYEKPIRIFERDDVFGEMALIDHKPRSMSARAEAPSRVLALRDTDFRRFVAEDGDLALAVMEGLNDRIRYTTDFLNKVRAWVGRISQGEYSDQTFAQEVDRWIKQDVSMSDPASAKYRDETLSMLAAEFAHMASKVKAREETLRREIEELKIRIDEDRRTQEVSRIKSSEGFQHILAQAKALREEAAEDDAT